MRLLSLELERYGPFTDRSLRFRPDAALHVVLGPNEAGKSSALAAVGDLLFGTRDTRHEFLHREAGLRLGATVAARDGRRLTVFRRRGLRNTLTDGNGAALPDDALGPFLGGIDRAVFCNAFGLNAETLRRSAQDMLRSEGEVGATLVAAASGLRGLRDVAKAIEAEAGELFTPRSRKLRLNDLVRDYEDARKAARADRIVPDALKRLESGLFEAEAALDAVTRRRRTIAEEASRLRRGRRVAPVLAAADRVEETLGAFADLPPADPVAVAELKRRLGAVDGATERLTAAEAALARAAADSAGSPAEDPLLPLGDEVDALADSRGAHAKTLRDLPRVQAEGDRFERDLAALAVRLGLSGPPEVERRQPSEVARSELRRLIAAGREIAAEEERLGRDLAEARRALAAEEAAFRERGALVDPAPLRARLDAVRPALSAIGRRDALREEVARTEGELDGAARRLRPGPGTALDRPDALPSRDQVERSVDAMAAAAAERGRRRDRLHAIRAEFAALEVRMGARRAAGDVPDRAALAGFRQERDAAWADVRAAALGLPEAPVGPALLDRVAAFERAGREADLLADRLVADARRASEHAADSGRLAQLGADERRAEAGILAADAEVVDAEAGWQALWRPLAITPSTPAAMRDWRHAVEGLLAQAEALSHRRREARAAADRVETARAPLEALAGRIGLPDLAGVDVGLLGERVGDRVGLLADAWDAARDGAARIAAAERAIEAGTAALAALSDRRNGWAEAWGRAAASCALPPTAALDDAAAALDSWNEVPALLRERDDRQRRVAGMKRDIAAFEFEVLSLAERAGTAVDRPAAEVARALGERVRAAREEAVARTARLRVRDEAARARDEARSAAAVADIALATFGSALGLPEGAANRAAFLARLEERARLQATLAGLREELARTGDGLPEVALRADGVAIDPDAVEGALAALAAEDERLDHDGRVAFAEGQRLRADRARLDESTGSEAATARKSAAEVAIRETARRYVVLKLGSLLLGAAIERHRAGRQDPLLVRAGALFRDLTGGRYEGLDQVFGEDDEPMLAGRRAGRQPVAVRDMSEGTGDQLFLALRLAFLEDYAGRAEPAPFLGDDLFASFDDERTEHGLSALAAIGDRVQPILFTHHEGVARAAERRLGNRVDIVPLR